MRDILWSERRESDLVYIDVYQDCGTYKGHGLGDLLRSR